MGRMGEGRTEALHSVRVSVCTKVKCGSEAV